MSFNLRHFRSRASAVRLIAAIVCAGDCTPLAAAQQADIVFINGPILTMDDRNPAPEAVAVTGTRITAVGSQTEIDAMTGPDTEVIDLAGQTLMPGFIDAHGHFPGAAAQRRMMVLLQSPPVGNVTTIGGLIAALRERAARTPKGQWIQGTGYDDTLLAENRHPTRADLDQVSTEHPIYIGHVSGHLAVANTAALKLAGVSAATPQPMGGKFRVDPLTGAPDGVLEETAMRLVSRLLPPFTENDIIAAIEDDAEAYASIGVTTAQNGAAGADTIQQLSVAYAAGKLPIRVDIWPRMDVRAAALDGTITLAAPAAQDVINITANKGFADGSIQGFTGYLSAPYHSHVHLEPGYRGYPRVPRERLADQVLRLHRAGYQLAIHANGDAAIDDVLFAYARALDDTPRSDARHIVVHAQMARDDQLDEMKRLGVIASFFNLHVYYWGDRHRDIFIGPDRAQRISPMRSARDRGVVFTLHADTPVVPMNPMLMVWSAVTRTTSGGAVLGPDQRITVIDALRSITMTAAYQGFAENDKGSISVGKLADLIMLDANLERISPGALRDIKVTRTFVGGKLVWPRDMSASGHSTTGPERLQ